MVASNVPSGSGWQYTLFSNSLVVTVVQMAFDELIAPRLVTILAKVKFGFKRSTDLSSEYVIRVYQSQAKDLLALCMCGSVLNAAGKFTSFDQRIFCACGTTDGHIFLG